jgi:hypothetical protein
MDNVTFSDVVDSFTNEVTTHVLIDHGNGEYTSMIKAEYDRQQAAQFTPILTGE